jgi:cytochrome c2
MRRTALFSIPVAVILGVSCSSGSSPAPAAAPAPAPAAGRGGAAQAPAQQTAGRAGAQAPAGGAAGAPGAPAGGRGAAPTLEQRNARRDSITAARAAMAAELITSLGANADMPAGTVFKNVQLMKTVTARQLVTAMDQGIGRALNRGCNDCHIVGKWDADSVARKNTARTMMGIVNDINANLLPRMGPGRGGAPRAIQCLTCHRGGQAGRNEIIP